MCQVNFNIYSLIIEERMERNHGKKRKCLLESVCFSAVEENFEWRKYPGNFFICKL